MSYTIFSKDLKWSYSYNDECFEKHASVGVQPYKFKDYALAKKEFIENELGEESDNVIIDNSTGKIVFPSHLKD